MSQDEALVEAFEAKRYGQVIEIAESQGIHSTLGWRCLGRSFMMNGDFLSAEMPLMRASAQGDLEASIELGNNLRQQGHFEKAIEHIIKLLPSLSDELYYKALRWLAVTEFQMGKYESAISKCEDCLNGFMKLDIQEGIDNVLITLAQMHLLNGDTYTAIKYYKSVLNSNNKAKEFRFPAFSGICTAYTDLGDLDNAKITLNIWESEIDENTSPYWQTFFISSQAYIYRLQNDKKSYLNVLLKYKSISLQMVDYETRVWSSVNLSECLSSLGKFRESLDEILRLPSNYSDPRISLAKGLLMKRQLFFDKAAEHLGDAISEQYRKESLRAKLHLADIYVHTGRREQGMALFGEALHEVIDSNMRLYFKPDIDELGSLVQEALLDPELSMYMSFLLEKYAAMLGGPPAASAQAPVTTVRLTTLGHRAIERDGEPVKLSLEGGVLLLTYLALNPSRTRRELERALYPDRDSKKAGDYLRSVFREFRTSVSEDLILMEGNAKMPRYRIHPSVDLQLDVLELRDALARGDLPQVLSLYRGEFLPRLKMPSRWADQLREELHLSVLMFLRSALRDLLDAADWKRAIALCTQILRLEPYDLAAARQRVELARRVASAQELAQYVVAVRQIEEAQATGQVPQTHGDESSVRLEYAGAVHPETESAGHTPPAGAAPSVHTDDLEDRF